MPRIARKLLVVAVVLLIIAVVVGGLIAANLGKIVKAGIETAGPMVLGVPMTVEDVSVRPIRGVVGLDELVIGGPEGFSETMFRLGHAHVDADVWSFTGDVMVINEVVIDGAEVTLEFSGTKTNWGALLASLESDETAEEPEAKEASSKKVQIGRIAFTNGKIRVAGIPVAGSATVPLPDLVLTDIGTGGSGGVTSREAVTEIVVKLYKGVLDAVGGIVPAEELKKVTAEFSKMASQATDAASQAIKDVGGKAGEAAKGALDSIFGGDD